MSKKCVHYPKQFNVFKQLHHVGLLRDFAKTCFFKLKHFFLEPNKHRGTETKATKTNQKVFKYKHTNQNDRHPNRFPKTQTETA